jgi:methyl-accepting chemotaxis protein
VPHSNLNIPKDIKNKIIKTGKGVLNENINGVEYTLSFVNVQELKGTFLIAVPVESYMGSVQELGKYIFYTVLVRVGLTTLFGDHFC